MFMVLLPFESTILDRHRFVFPTADIMGVLLRGCKTMNDRAQAKPARKMRLFRQPGAKVRL
jgi:hypothetical protein